MQRVSGNARGVPNTTEPRISGCATADRDSISPGEALRFAGRGEPVDDLLQVARLGMLKAVERFDPPSASLQCLRPSTIAGELRAASGRRGRCTFREASRICTPASAEPAPPWPPASVAKPAAELAKEVGSSVDEVLEALELRSAYRPTSINAPIDTDGTTADPAAASKSDGIDPAIDSMLVANCSATWTVVSE